jgi:putative transposase
MSANFISFFCAISDASWHGFVNLFEYKAQELDRHLIKVDQWYASSKTCSHCNNKIDDMPLHTRNLDCPSCKKKILIGILTPTNIKKKGIIELKAAGLVVSAGSSA